MKQTPNKELMQQARESLSGKWVLAICTFLIYMIIVGGLQAAKGFGQIISLIVSGPFAIGISYFSLSLARNEEARIEQIFDGFQNFVTALVAYLLVVIYSILWLLLLIIPGVIAMLSYSMTFFIIAENPTIGANEAIDKSKTMMDGHKMKYFRLMLRFLGLALLCVLTLGIGFLWFIPYIHVTNAKFYDDIKGETFTEEEVAQPMLD